jgi:hypothetical protein
MPRDGSRYIMLLPPACQNYTIPNKNDNEPDQGNGLSKLKVSSLPPIDADLYTILYYQPGIASVTAKHIILHLKVEGLYCPYQVHDWKE